MCTQSAQVIREGGQGRIHDLQTVSSGNDAVLFPLGPRGYVVPLFELWVTGQHHFAHSKPFQSLHTKAHPKIKQQKNQKLKKEKQKTKLKKRGRHNSKKLRV